MAVSAKIELLMGNKGEDEQPIYKDYEFEAIKLQYETQTLLLRFLTEVDLKIFTGYITVQMLFGGWLALNPATNLLMKIGLFVINLSLGFIVGMLLHNNYQRRKEVGITVNNLNEALGYTQPNIYLPGKELNAPANFRPWWPWYLFGIAIGTTGVCLIIFAI